jgi:hypothetical protein
MHSQYTEVLQIYNVLFWNINYNKNERVKELVQSGKHEIQFSFAWNYL